MWYSFRLYTEQLWKHMNEDASGMRATKASVLFQLFQIKNLLMQVTVYLKLWYWICLQGWRISQK